MQKLADISFFESLQAHANAQMGLSQMDMPQKGMSSMSVFNASMDDIQVSVGEYMTQIDALRSIGADSEAGSEESKLEGLLDDLDSRIKVATKTSMQMVADFRRNGGVSRSESRSEDTAEMPGGMSEMPS